MASKIVVFGVKVPATVSVTTTLSKTVSQAEYWFVRKGRKHRLIISPGFVFDGASIPRLCWTLLGLAPHGIMDGPAVPHDAGYETQGHFTIEEEDGSLAPAPLVGEATARFEVWDETRREFGLCSDDMTRSEMDELLLRLCEWVKIDLGRPQLVWAGVRSCGWWAWKRNDPERKTQAMEAES
jgi:hypothetical protein